MRYRQLGKSDLTVSEIALGSWRTYGTAVDRRATRQCVDTAIECGINFFDTANMYGKGAAEVLLGESLRRYKRNDFILGTKVFYPMSRSDRGLSNAQIHKQLDASLKRLKTDYIDLYQCHRFDKETPLEETMHALTEVVRSGKVRWIGFSEWSAGQVARAHAIEDVERFVSSQPRYSMLYRKPERKIFPIGSELGLGQIVWSPLAQGVLTGKYKPEHAPPKGSRGADHDIGFSSDDVLAAVQRLRPIAQSLDITVSQLAIAWVLSNPQVSAAIIGASNADQIKHNIQGSGLALDQSVLSQIDQALGTTIRQ